MTRHHLAKRERPSEVGWVVALFTPFVITLGTFAAGAGAVAAALRGAS